MQIARITTHCGIAKCALKKLSIANLLLLNKPRLTFKKPTPHYNHMIH